MADPVARLPAFDEAFFAACPYSRTGFFLDEILELDPARARVLCRCETSRTSPPFPLLDAQRNDPVLHPAHVPGAVLVHLTGSVGFVLAYHLHGIAFDRGWIGYGSRIHRAEFRRMARIGPPLLLEGREAESRARGAKRVTRYEFQFRQEGELVYYGEQTAFWFMPGAATAGGVDPHAQPPDPD